MNAIVGGPLTAEVRFFSTLPTVHTPLILIAFLKACLRLWPVWLRILPFIQIPRAEVLLVLCSYLSSTTMARLEDREVSCSGHHLAYFESLFWVRCPHISLSLSHPFLISSFSYLTAQLLIVAELCLCDSFATPCTVARQTPLSMGFSRQEYWSRLSFPSPGDLPIPGIKHASRGLQADSLCILTTFITKGIVLLLTAFCTCTLHIHNSFILHLEVCTS